MNDELRVFIVISFREYSKGGEKIFEKSMLKRATVRIVTGRNCILRKKRK